MHWNSIRMGHNFSGLVKHAQLQHPSTEVWEETANANRQSRRMGDTNGYWLERALKQSLET